MNLIDILNQILSTKKEIKDIIKHIDASDDISRYPVTIHNYITNLYNDAFVRGYKSKWLELNGTEAVVTNPRDILQYSNVNTYYTSYDPDVLTVIMRDVLTQRLGMKREINTSSDYFPSYPDSLRAILEHIENDGYTDGENAATSNNNTGITELVPPILTYSNNIFYLYSPQDNVKMLYAFGDENGPISPWTVYTGYQAITESTWVYTMAKYNGLGSPVSDPGYYCQYVDNGYQPGTGTPTPSTGTEDPITPPNGGNPGGSGTGTGDGPGSTPVTPGGSGGTTTTLVAPTYSRNGNVIYISCATTNAIIMYRFDFAGTFMEYNEPIFISHDTWIEAYSYLPTDPENPSGTMPYMARYLSGDTPPSETIKIPSKPTFTQMGDNVYISCSTTDADIWYRVNQFGDFVQLIENPILIYDTNTLIEAYSHRVVDFVDYYSDTTSGFFSPAAVIPPGPGTGEGGNPGGWTGDGGTTPPNYEPVNKPIITMNSKNVISLSNLTPGATTLVKITSIEGSSWFYYDGPFQAYETWVNEQGVVSVIAYSQKGNVTSPTASEWFRYIPEEDWPDYYVETPIMTVDENYQVILSCSTEDAAIYYQLGGAPDASGEWHSWRPDPDNWDLYTGPFTPDGDNVLWTYATMNDPNWADSHIATYVYFEPLFVPEPPEPPVIQYFDPDRIRVIITAQYGFIHWKYGPDGEWNETNIANVVLAPQERCVIYAKAHSNDTGLESEEVTFDFAGLDHLYSLIPPQIEYKNNYFTISNPNENGIIFYTTDGSDPYGRTNMYVDTEGGSGGFGVPYNENTFVRAVVIYTNSNDETYMSKESSKWCLYDENNIDWTYEYFAVKGATEIHVTGNSNNIMTLLWSYDKINWTDFSNSVTGLDPEKWVYLDCSVNGKYWNNMYFGPNDQVTIAGNVYTLIYARRRFPYEVPYEYMLKSMFENCEQLVDATNLSLTFANLKGHDMEYMFKNCVNLVNGPSRIPNVHKLERYSCHEMFAGCTNLEYMGQFDIESVKEYSCQRMFADCPKLTTFRNINIDDDIPMHAFEECFSGCLGLLNCTMNIKGDITGIDAFKKCFFGCESLSATSSINSVVGDIIDINLRSENLYTKCYESMFEGCSSMTSFGILPATVIPDYAYRFMFRGCSSLTSAPKLSGISLGNACYCSMFENCTSLEKAPDLIAENLNGGIDCYMQLFKGCSKLNYIYAAFLDDISKESKRTYYTYQWVDGVAEYGTFVQNDDATWFITGIHAIPEKWVTSGALGRVGNIVDIDCNYTTVVITADNDDTIFYRINGGDWNLYTGPFDIYNESMIDARCRNGRGDYGQIYTETIKPEIPKPVISQNGNEITITAPSGFNYDVIYFSINYFDWGNNIIPPDYVEIYDGPFTVDARSYIHAQGMVNGYKSEYSHWMAEVHVPEPVIDCTNNIVSMTADVAEGLQWRIMYKINDTEDSIGGWTEYVEPFVITEDCTITAKTAIYSIGGERYSDLVSVDCVYDPNGASYVLHVPVLKQWDNSNMIYLRYGNKTYMLWSDDEIGIKYKIGENGTWTDYTHQFPITEDCTIYVYAYDNNTQSITASYDFTYNSSIEGVEVPNPTYYIDNTSETVGGHDYLYVYNELPNTTNYYRLSDAEWLYSHNPESDYRTAPGTGKDLFPLLSAKIYMISSIVKDGITYFSDPVQTIYINNHTYDFAVGVPRISFNRETNTVTIDSNSEGVITYYRFDNRPQSTGMEYNAPFTITQDHTIHAWNVSATDDTKISNEYTLFCDYNFIAPVTISFNGNTFSLSVAVPGSSLQYSYNGTTWTRYSNPVYTESTVTVYARAYKDFDYGREYSDVVSTTHEYDTTVSDPSYSIDYTTTYPTVTLSDYSGAVRIDMVWMNHFPERNDNGSSLPETINVYYGSSWHTLNRQTEDRWPYIDYTYFEFVYNGPFMVECSYTYRFVVDAFLKKDLISGYFIEDDTTNWRYKTYAISKGVWVSNFKPLVVASAYSNYRNTNVFQTNLSVYGWQGGPDVDGAWFGPAPKFIDVNGVVQKWQDEYCTTLCYRIDGGNWTPAAVVGTDHINLGSMDFNQIEFAPGVVYSAKFNGQANPFVIFDIGPITKYFRDQDNTIPAPVVASTSEYSDIVISNYSNDYNYFWYGETTTPGGMYTNKYPNYKWYRSGWFGQDNEVSAGGIYGIFATRKDDGTYRSPITKFTVS